MDFVSNFDIEYFKQSISHKKGKLCGIDFGTHKIGVALTDESGTLGFPFTIYIRKNINCDIEYFTNLIENQKIIGFVIGVVLREDNSIENPRLFHLTKFFFKKLFSNPILINKKIPHYFHDESFSSHLANELLHRYKFNKNQIARYEDKIAATRILNEVLEEMRC